MTHGEFYYPPWGFCYKVNFKISKNKHDMSFQSVSGLSVEYDYENYKEGGENRFEHKLPVRTKYSDLVLKRGMLTDSAIINWLLDAFRDRKFVPTDIEVFLIDEKSKILRTWKIAHAIPKKWLISDLNANENAIVIETMELTYRYFTLE